MITNNHGLILPTHWRDFLSLTKPRVMTLVVFTGICGLLAAPGTIHPFIAFVAILCIAVGAGGAAALNQWYEAEIDAGMKRTAQRPLPAGRMDQASARDFGIILSAGSVMVMGLGVGWLAAVLLAVSIVYYAVVYTIWLKPRTPQNIVVGGGAGAFPPLIGWVAVTGDVTLMPLVLFAIIFLWTPPHFWALALFVKSDYANVGIPMMPVVAGEMATRRQILAYTVILTPMALMPWFIGGAGLIYLSGAAVLSLLFFALALPVGLRTSSPEDGMRPEKRLFAFSIVYLFALFGILVLDRLIAYHGVLR
ncbi:heme o synthase [Croceicoccus sp. F390]|uniref:Protoheme IX farnesyltransferase n=1 Tax=Croceicoccus esteveae TaxID=3075597 RepID=A0ABU2ZGP8_9SPHN|nr:heme o synthase [Croceicoccus sp. F390]MDT0575253.1 heme o synthase [Croceicoccus sp. F390]